MFRELRNGNRYCALKDNALVALMILITALYTGEDRQAIRAELAGEFKAVRAEIANTNERIADTNEQLARVEARLDNIEDRLYMDTAHPSM